MLVFDRSDATHATSAEQLLLLAACPLCGSREWTLLAGYPQLTWVRCPCGLVYKRSTHADLGAEAYAEEYFSNGAGGRSYHRRTRRRVSKARHQILDLLNHAARGPLLDVGCSTGYTLRAAESLGLACCGVDCSDYAVRTCRSQGFQVEAGSLANLPFTTGTFSLVMMKHVLEHTPDPRRALAELHRVLRPGGGVFFALPHAGYRKAVRAPQRYGFFRPERHGVAHFVYYTPQTLTRLLHEEGFEVRRVHPHLLHGHAPLAARMLQCALAAPRWAAQRIADGLALRKEFWLVAVRVD